MDLRIPNKIWKLTNYQNDVGGQKRLSFILSQVIDKKRSRSKKLDILDVGCGTGSVTIPLAFFGDSVVGIDLDEKSIMIADERNMFDNLKFYKQDISKIDKKFDIITCIQVIEHLKKPEALIAELGKKLKQDGILILSTPNGYGYSEFVNRIISSLKKIMNINSTYKTNDGQFTSDKSPHIQKFTVKKIKQMLSKNNLTIKKIKKHMFLMSGFPFNMLFFKFPKKISRCLEKIDSTIADQLPAFCSTGWYFVLRRV